MTHLCVPIFVTELAKARREMAAAAAGGADLLELRIDALHDPNVLTLLLRDRLLPVIVTCRPAWEGGQAHLQDEERLVQLRRGVENGAAYADIELKTALKQTAALGARQGEAAVRWIVSFHDFSGPPDDLGEVVRQLDETPAEVNKIVWTAASINDNIEAVKLLQQARRPTIALCMGEAGIISRVLARKFGAFLSFASLSPEAATAPGQPTIADMKRLYRWDAIGAATKVYGVVAHPVRHSMSPAIHNAAFTATGYDGIYLPMLVNPDYESFRTFIEDFLNQPGMDLSGLSVTIPHKQNALRFLRETGAEVDELSARIGAINTIVIGRGGDGSPKLSGRNTDYAAILDSITAELNVDRAALKGLRTTVIGAGGTGRSAVAALAHYGASVVIANRTPQRAQSLAAEFDGHNGPVKAIAIGDLGKADCQVLINTTSAGMSPNVEETPFGNGPVPIHSRMLVFDTIYNPLRTKLLAQADGLGARTISGVEMFVRQAVAQFEAWTGKPAPVGVMRQVISDRLGLPLHSR